MSFFNRVVVPAASALACVGLMAAPVVAGTPAENVVDAKQAGAVFASADLFSQSVSLTDAPAKAFSAQAGAADALEHGTLLTLDAGAVKALNEAAPEALRLEIPFGIAKSGRLTLELLKVNPFTPDFEVVTSSPEPGAKYDLGTHYRGVVAGDSESLVAVSVFADDLMIFADTADHGIVSVGALEGRTKGPRTYIAFADEHLKGFDKSMECGVDDSDNILGQDSLLAESARLPIERPGSMGVSKAAGDCVKIYLEADYNIYQNKGSTQATTNWVTGVYNQVAALYNIDNIETGLSQVFVWNSSSPYTSSSNTSTLLSQFQNYRTSHNGNLAHLMKLGNISGVAAGFNGICTNTSQSQSVAYVQSSYSNVPTYSGTVFVVAHEIGHTAGSRHTHACVWNGNNTAIDGCAGYVEGNCSLPGNPSSGGTIMSYCPNASVGVNFNKGFHAQPASVIQGKIAAAGCLQSSCGGELQNGVPVSGISGGQGSQANYTMDVPSGASNLSFQSSGGSGDADLYVRFGSAPTTSSYDCRPYLNGNNETCSFASPQTGTYYVMLRGYTSYSGVTLEGNFTEGNNPNSCSGNCGGQAPGGCWCDSQCAQYGDCCADKVPVCG